MRMGSSAMAITAHEQRGSVTSDLLHTLIPANTCEVRQPSAPRFARTDRLRLYNRDITASDALLERVEQQFMLGLPYVADGPLLRTARDLRAPVLLSANAFSRWYLVDGERRWTGFGVNRLALLNGMDAYLDSAGFVAMVRYGRYPWSVDDYLDLAAAHPWRWFAARDFCCEPEIADDTQTVLDRISMTSRALVACRNGARERGILDRLMPVVQGRTLDQYERCLDRISFALDDAPLLGVGSVCRRNVTGPDGILEVVERIDRVLGTSPLRLHLFGCKSSAASLLRSHPRVASFDSQAYGVRARVLARDAKISKSNAFLAEVMREWY
jgi:hypothetical protein